MRKDYFVKMLISILSMILVLIGIIIYAQLFEAIINHGFSNKYSLVYLTVIIIPAVLIITFNLFLWLHALIFKSLTPEQEAERKAVRIAKLEALKDALEAELGGGTDKVSGADKGTE